jgi:ethanolamine permease
VSAMVTLVILALLTFFTAVGVNGWETVVYKPGSTTPSDSPLPLALGSVVGQDHPMYHLLIMIGLCGLLASFHGIILVAGRATFEFGRVGYLPRWFGTTHVNRQTPVPALLLNLLIGFVTLLTGHTGEIITISVFGALTMYVISMISLLRLRKTQPDLARPFKTPLYPWTPAIALALSLVCLGSMAFYNRAVGLIFLALLAVAYAWFFYVTTREAAADLS